MKDRLLQDIEDQPRNLDRVLDYQAGAGAAFLAGAARAIRQSQSVVLTGMGSSLFASISAEHVFRRTGIHARTVEAGELLHYGRDLLESACLVMTSRSGESIEVERLLDAGAATTVGITNVPNSTLARRADHCLLVNSLPDEMVAIQTYTAGLAVLLLLAGESMDEIRCAVAKMPAWIESWKGKAPDLVAGSPVLYFLGRGPSIGSALAGQLALHEIGKHPSIAMSSAAFRHGPLEVIDSGFRAVVFAPDGPAGELNRGLARDIETHGGKATIVESHVSDTVAPLLEAVPSQLAGYSLAQAKGIVPGQFRHATQVTRTE